MFKLVIACCLVASVLGAYIPDVSDSLEMSGRVVGGSTAVVGQFPFIGSLRSIIAGHLCQVSLFSTRWIITTAYCAWGRGGYGTIIVFGTVSRTIGGTSYEFSRLILHPSFSRDTYENDIAIGELSREVVLTANIAPGVLGSNFVSVDAATLAGWGQTSNPGSLSPNLQYVTLSVLTNDECRHLHNPGNAARVFDSNICTSTQNGHGTCVGDGGSPLFQGNTIIGVTSWGIACVQGYPDVYIRVSNYRDWIRGISGI